MNQKLKNHDLTLKKEVFFTEDKWPHFELLFKDIKKLSNNLNKKSNVLSLERTGLYGGISLFAPYFYNNNFTSVDCSSDKILKRGAYNSKFVKNSKIIKIPFDLKCNYKNLQKSLNKKIKYDLILIPNLIHHIFDNKFLLKQCKSLLKKNGILYIFEPLLRELHQKPDDYFRFTPFSLKKTLKKIGFKNFKFGYSGGPFTATAYCWDQALQYLPKKISKNYAKIINFQKFLILEKKYTKNLVRKHTSFPVSFSIISKNV